MLACAGRATRADLGDVNLIDRVELGRAHTSQQAGKAGHEAGAHDQRHAVLPGLPIE